MDQDVIDTEVYIKYRIIFENENIFEKKKMKVACCGV
jgi:hypothetical protein